ncbi:hypothetical protein TVAG_117060 [Trichomonas vaginalis G3]|uniref:Uncharacterized protein n=1 Tax=Trichomonas vaginalis (strain ATCC PRA-98 / G3) TaxID=412133 RepID=A2E3P6_TRIV3|nr:biological adhesion protein [Trichomonas vaginalis G3]EAY12684.1 hypothetical protein TVAG_117060 [Trichomonas vaginalis G3]KAI5517554.1 biological adhesion protein [Trichomonas vaginalis G3]|eukprot:XP_001324907.1 hypothetical protein [Trichomonas vaginalis G3]
MSDVELSECSYLTEMEDPAIAAKDNQIRDLTFEKQRLEDLVKNLQSSLENVKTQLKDTIAAVDTSNTVSSEIQKLKKEVADLTTKKEQLERQVEILTNSSNDATKKFSDEVTSLTSQRDEAISNLEKSDERVNKLRKERQELRTQVQEKDELLQAITEDYQKCKTQKKKLAQKYTTAAEQLTQAEQEKDALAFENQKLVNDRTTINSEIESLRLKIETAKSFNNDIEGSLQPLQNELQQKNELISALEEQIDSQREEIQNYAEERQKILDIMQAMQKALADVEGSFEQLQNENAALKLRVKNGAKPVSKPFATQQDFDNLSIPFTGDLKARSSNIMQLPQYTPFQRLQLVLNESAKQIQSLTEQVTMATKKAEATQKAFDNFAVDQVIYSEICDALIEDLKKLATNQELINNCPLSEGNEDFLEYLNQKIEETSQAVQREAIKDPKYVNSDFFFANDVKQRQAAIKKLLQPENSTFTLFCGQFLTNVFLQNQLNAVTAPLQLIDSMTKSGALKGTQLSDVPHLIETLNVRVNHTTKQNKKLTNQLKKAQAHEMELAQSENEKKTKISELSLQVDNLQNEIGVLNVKLQVANNELLLKKNECGSLNEFAKEIRAGVEEKTNDQKERTAKLEAALAQKTRECDELSTLLHDLKRSVDENTNATIKRMRKNEESYLNQIEALNNQVDEYEAELQKRRKIAKRTEKALKEQYDNSLKEMAAHYEEGKKNLEETITSLRDKAENSREMSKKLVENMSEVEKRNVQLTKENTELNQTLKNIKQEQTNFKNSMNKANQQKQAQLAAQLMAVESKAQQQIADERRQAQKKVQELLTVAYENIGTFYGVEESEYDVEAYQQSVKSARDDLDKLRYFQNESTKLAQTE